MITNFEKITADLTEDELAIKEDVLDAIKHALPIGKKLKSDALEYAIEYYLNVRCSKKIQFTSTRLRKWVNYFRSCGILAILATSKGYYISNDPEEIMSQIDSLEERARSIQTAATGLRILHSQL